MRRTLILSLSAAAALWASDPAWLTKPPAQWDRQDAKQVLANSPWVKLVTPGPIPSVSEGQHRDGGRMGGNSKGVGLRALLPSNLLGVSSTSENGGGIVRPVAIRWESSLPVRISEAKTGERKLPLAGDDYYAIAVYGMPAKLNRKDSLTELKKSAFLQLDGKKTIQPARAEILAMENGLANVLYLFPRSPRVATGHSRIEFLARIESLYVAQFFSPQEMYFQGKLEL